MEKFIKFIFVLILMPAICFSQIKTIAIENMDNTVKPGDNFYLYVNGGWLSKAVIPPYLNRYGSFDELQESNITNLKSLVDELISNSYPDGSNYQKISDFFVTGIDSAAVEAAGVSPLDDLRQRINSIKSNEDLQNVIAYLHTYRFPVLFGVYAGPDQKNSSSVIINLGQSGMTLSDRDYYLNTDERNTEIRKQYVIYMTSMFENLGYSSDEAAKRASTVLNMETEIAKFSYGRLELRDPLKNYYKTNLDELKSICPQFAWDSYFRNIGIEPPTELDISQTTFFKGLNGFLTQFSLDDFKVYLEWHILNPSASFLSSKFVNDNFNFYGKFFSGQKELKPRWRRVLDVISGTLGEALGQIYVEKYFPPEYKQRARELVENVRAALRNRIQNLDWMSSQTKKNAIEKLDKMTIKVGYPDKWRDYTNLKIDKKSYFGNLISSRKFGFDYNMSKLGKPVDKLEWHMTPQTVNAYYDPVNNEIVFPAAILQPPFFYANGDDAMNYGGIGAVIGHEITHGFDDNGRLYDKDGNMKDWWTEEDAAKYKVKTDAIVEQYNNIKILDSLHVDGKLTLGENIADIGGVTIALDAVQIAWSKNPPPEKIDGFTPLQRFFISYAQIWRTAIRDKEQIRRLKEDEHSPAIARVNGVVYNIPQFYQAFNLTPVDKLYKSEKDRNLVW
jgi:putative endopeptidase